MRPRAEPPPPTATAMATMAYFALLLLAVAALRAPVFFNRAFNSDELYYAVGAEKLLAGGLFYRDVVDHKPPGIYWIYAAVLGVTRNHHSLAGIYVAMIGAVWLTAVLLSRVGTHLLGVAAGRAAGVLYVVSSAIGPAGDFLAANGELFMNLPAIAAMALACVPSRPLLAKGDYRSPYLRAIGSGLLTAAGALIKPQAAAIGVPLAIYWLTTNRAGRPVALREGGGFSRRLIASYVLAALVPAVSLVLGYRAAHALQDLTWAMHYGATVYTQALGLREKIVNGVRNSTLMALVYVPLLIPATLFVNRLRRAAPARDTLVLCAWLVAGFVAIGAGGRFYPHYYIQILPPLSLLAAAGLTTRGHPARGGPTDGPRWETATGWQPGRVRRLLGWALLVEAVLSTAIACSSRWLWPRGAATDQRSRAVGAFIDAHVAPDARILVWGNSPEIYFYGRRLPATRFLSSNYQTGHVWGTASNRDGALGEPTARSAWAWSHLLEELRQSPPALVIDAAAGGLGHMERDPIDQQPELRSWLAASCRRLPDIAAMPIYACRAAPPATPDGPAASTRPGHETADSHDLSTPTVSLAHPANTH